MKFQLSFIYLTLKLFLYLSTNVIGQYYDSTIARQSFRKIASQKPTTSEITIAISDLNLSQDIQIEKLQEFFYIGQYPDDFIDLLNKSKTLSDDPIKLSSDEITTLTSKHDGGSKNNRIITQFKFYQKVQEIQCTSYALLMFTLPKVKVPWEVISNYVSNIIEMSYRGKFIVSSWLWELLIKLLGIENETLATQKFLEEHLPVFTRILQELIITCQENKYLMKNFDSTLNDYSNKANHHLLLDKILKIYDQKYPRFVKDELYKLSIDVDNLLLINIWNSYGLFSQISGLAFDWNLGDLVNKEVDIIQQQYACGEWTTQPFNYINLNKIVLDLIKAQFYSYIWLHLAYYQKTGINARSEHDSFLIQINYMLSFVYTDDPIFNKVLILLSEIYEPQDKKINETVNMLKEEVNNIISNYTEHQEINIDYECMKHYKDNLVEFLKYSRNSFQLFLYDISIQFEDINLSAMLFYINGKKTTDYVFPNK